MTAIAGLGPSARESSPETEKRAQIATAAREFEAMFLLQMLKQMRQSMLSGEAAEPGLGATTMFETIDVELSRHLAGQRGGLATMLESALGGGPAGAAVAPSAPVPVPARAPSSATELVRLDGQVTSDFGWRQDPLTGAKRFHRGIDIKAAYGQEVPVAAPGTVVFAGQRGGYGNLVIVEHEGGSQTRYAHLSQVDVREGEAVTAGDVVGRVGQTGRATGPHLHFEVVEDGRPVDPSENVRVSAPFEQH